MGKLGEAYKKQAKAPRKGVKAQDADEYQNKGIEGWNKSVESHGAYRNQACAPTGTGSRGPSQQDGSGIKNWNSPVKQHGAYNSQEKWGNSSEKASMGFKLPEQESAYLGHFAQDKNLRQGHNDLFGSIGSALGGFASGIAGIGGGAGALGALGGLGGIAGSVAPMAGPAAAAMGALGGTSAPSAPQPQNPVPARFQMRRG